MSIEWGDPPAASTRWGRRDRAWGDVAAALRSRPGQWAKVATADDGTMNKAVRQIAHHIRFGENSAFQPPHSFEAVGRLDDEGRVAVWARYVGNGNTP